MTGSKGGDVFIVNEGVMYKISATIIKPGNPPVLWIRFSKKAITQGECEHFFSIKKEAGFKNEINVTLLNFRCDVINL